MFSNDYYDYTSSDNNENTTIVEDETSDNNEYIIDDEKNTTTIDNNIVLDSNESNTTIADDNATKIRYYTPFEKKFINHTAYNHYKRAIKSLYEGDYLQAYKSAMLAKKYNDGTSMAKDGSYVIKLPFVPGYLRESPLAPRRNYYKVLIEEDYYLDRLITKIKLQNPPIPMVTIKQTSTSLTIIVKNLGDTPLDNFTVFINGEEVKKFPKILSQEEVSHTVLNIDKLQKIAFKEDYGFAPQKDIILPTDDDEDDEEETTEDEQKGEEE